MLKGANSSTASPSAAPARSLTRACGPSARAGAVRNCNTLWPRFLFRQDNELAAADRLAPSRGACLQREHGGFRSDLLSRERS